MPILTPGRIRHSVIFRLARPSRSDAERDFLEAISALARIPGVEAFEVMREVSPKNGYSFALTMEFADRDAYVAYDEDPRHVRFVTEHWAANVEDWIEVDTETI
jgi:heme-degrading monooxygenase HmoA